MAEAQEYGDILLLDIPDCDDPDPPPPGTDSATSLKVVHSMAWAVKHYNFDYFIRIGDDTYLRINYFPADVAPSLPKGRMLLGYCEGEHMHHVFKARHPNVAQIDVPYCSGMGFVLTYDAALFAAQNAEMLAMEFPEDAMVARWFVGTRVEIVHNARFVDWAWNKCDNETILVHKHNF